MKRILFAALSLACAAFAANADDAIVKNFKYAKALLPGLDGSVSDRQRVLSFDLDPDIYAATQPGFPDLRVFSGSKEIPYSIRRVEASSVKMPRLMECPSRLLSFTRSPENQVEMVIERLKGLPQSEMTPCSLVISTRSKNFEKRVRIQVGDSPEGPWREISDEVPIFDYSDFINFSRTSVSFPETAASYFKVIITNYSEEGVSPVEGIVREFRGGLDVAEYRHTLRQTKALKIDALLLMSSIETVTEVPELVQPYPVESFSSRVVGQETIVNVDVRREPLKSLALITDSSYFMRRALVECAEDAGGDWRPLASGAIHSIGNGPSRDSSLLIEFPETRASLFRVRIFNGDATPLAISGVVAKGVAYRLEFIGASDLMKDLKAFYGAETMRIPVYDTDAVLSKMKSERAIALTLGPQEANKAYGSCSTLHKFDSRKILYVVAILAALLMALLIYKGIGGIDPKQK